MNEVDSKILNQILKIMTRRDHSEKEIRKKLKTKFEDLEKIELAIKHASERGWIPAPENLSEQFSSSLHRKKKGILYINSALKEKGLPTINFDEEVELQKATRLIQSKYRKIKHPDKTEQAKMIRFLQSRGFRFETIQKLMSSLKRGF